MKLVSVTILVTIYPDALYPEVVIPAIVIPAPGLSPCSTSVVTVIVLLGVVPAALNAVISNVGANTVPVENKIPLPD